MMTCPECNTACVVLISRAYSVYKCPECEIRFSDEDLEVPATQRRTKPRRLYNDEWED